MAQFNRNLAEMYRYYLARLNAYKFLTFSVLSPVSVPAKFVYYMQRGTAGCLFCSHSRAFFAGALFSCITTIVVMFLFFVL